MKVIIAAAGTGGHINPGIAIANKIEKENNGSDIRFIATGKKLEEDLISKAGYKSYKINAYGFSKQISINNFKRIIKTLKGFKEAEKILEEFKPDIVIGTGGYICGAVISAAKKLNIPTLLHESNAYPGLAIRMLQKKTDTILVGIEAAKKNLKKSKRVVYTGNPTKTMPIELTKAKITSIYKEHKLNNKLPIVLVFGGSQGAKRINDTMINLINDSLNENYQIIWATGQGQYDDIMKQIDKKKIKNASIVPYIYNMAEVLSISSLVVARSGAMTLTELALFGKPAIFVPLPSSSSNRQEDNARVFENNGAAKIILNNNLNEDNLNNEIKNIILNKLMLEKMGKSAKKMAVYDVEERIYKEIEKLVR